MQLSPRELDHLALHQVGFLAQKRLARGLRLNHPEAIGLIATAVLERIRDGATVAELMEWGRTLLGRRQVMPGVPEMIGEVQVEGTFPDGTKLVSVHHPIAAEHGDLTAALYGSFLPVPDAEAFAGEGGDSVDCAIPGERVVRQGEIALNPGRERITIAVTNTADRPIQVGSHFHFGETNPYLRFDRGAAYGRRLDIPAGTAVRFEPGETKEVDLVGIGGARVIRGGNALADGPVGDANRETYLRRVAERGFAHREGG